MPIELDNDSIRFIGNNFKGLRFYDDTGALVADIYVDAAGRLNIGDALIVGTDGVSGGSSAPAPAPFASGAPFLTLATDTGLSAERVLTPGSGIAGVDAGAGSTYTLSVDTSVVRTTRQVATGTGLTGGGALSADRTLAVDTSVAFTWAGLHTFNAGIVIGGGSLAFGADAAMSRVGANIIGVASGDTLQSANYAAGVSGWMTSDTFSEFENVRVRGELVSTVLKFNELSATAGTDITTKSGSTAAADFTTAASIGSSFTVSAKDSDDGGARFEVNDIVWIKTYQGGAIRSIYATVTAVGAQTGTFPNQVHAYTFRLESGSTSATIRAGTAIIDLGPANYGWISQSADGGIGYSANLSIVTHAGAPWATQTLQARLGNLRGSYGIDTSTNRYGIGIGDYSSNTYLIYDGTRGFQLVAGAANVAINGNGIQLTKGAGTSLGALKFYDSNSYASQIGALSVERGTYADALLFTDATAFDQYARTYIAAIGDTAAANTRREQYIEANTNGRWGAIVYGGGNDASAGGGLQVSATDQGQVGIVPRGVVHAQVGMKVGTWSAGTFTPQLTIDSGGAIVTNGAITAGGQISGATLRSTTSNAGRMRKASGAGAQSITNATLTVVTFNTDDYDGNGFEDPGTNNTSIFAPTAGMYMIAVAVAFASNSTGYRAVHIRINGVSYVASDTRQAANGDRTIVSFACLNPMAAGDYAQVVVLQTSGGALNVEALDYYSAHLAMAKVA